MGGDIEHRRLTPRGGTRSHEVGHMPKVGGGNDNAKISHVLTSRSNIVDVSLVYVSTATEARNSHIDDTQALWDGVHHYSPLFWLHRSVEEI